MVSRGLLSCIFENTARWPLLRVDEHMHGGIMQGEFMDEILSQWVDEDSKFSSDKSAANRASFGAAPVVTQKTSMFSLKTRTHSPRSPDSDLSPRPSNGGFWADPSPAIIGSRSTAGSSLASLASHSLSGHAQPLAPMSSGISVGSRMFTGLLNIELHLQHRNLA